MATETEVVRQIREEYRYGFSNPDEAEAYFFKSGRGISHEVVEAIAEHKKEPDWMRKYRHKSLDYFLARPLPQWGGNLNDIDFDNIYYYIKPTEKQASSWEDLPAEIKDTWDKLGIPEAVKQYLGTIIPQNDNKFAALNSAVWSGGSFIYVPPGVHIEMPLQAYFRINA